MEKGEIKCWKCGKREATQEQYGYPVCDECADEGINPEEMEMVVIESRRRGKIVPLDSIDEEKYK
ncbi:MAG: hypothetical protein U9N61_00150 [Euryarchaeota archaeon]|nr:hypothetical protein [Euryarchaeota archaeon]